MVEAEIMSPFVKRGDPFWNFIARNRNNEGKKRFKQGDSAD
jgi:hypothetical protein